MSQNNQALRSAFEKGYRVVNGCIITPTGKTRVATISNDGYSSFNFGLDGKKIGVKVHRLVAYEKFGESALITGVHVRHMDGNPSNNLPDNIAIGSAHENSMDRPKENRISHAAKGRQKFTSAFIQSLRDDHKSGLGYKKLRKKHGIPLSTLSYYLSSKAKNTTFSFAV